MAFAQKDIYQALTEALGQEKDPTTLGEILTTVSPLLPESVIAKVKQSFSDHKPFKVSQAEIEEINQKFGAWWNALPSPKYDTWQTELRHWLDVIGVRSEKLL